MTRVVNRKRKVDLSVVFFRLPKKPKPKNRLSFFRSFFFHVPCIIIAYKYIWKPRYGWTHGQLRHTAAAAAAQQQQQWRQRKGAVVGVGRLNTSTSYLLHSLQYYRQVHNPLVFHYWFMLRLSVTPLPKMNCELTSHDLWDCCLFLTCVVCYQVCVMCCVVRWCLMRGTWWSVFMRFFAR